MITLLQDYFVASLLIARQSQDSGIILVIYFILTVIISTQKPSATSDPFL